MRRGLGIVSVLVGLSLCAWFVLGEGDAAQEKLTTRAAGDDAGGPAPNGSARRKHPSGPNSGRDATTTVRAGEVAALDVGSSRSKPLPAERQVRRPT